MIDAPKKPIMTREEFEASWNDGYIAPFIKYGRLSIECHEDHYDSSDPWCRGWKMSSVAWLEDDLKLYGNTQAEVDAAIAHRLGLLAGWENK